MKKLRCWAFNVASAISLLILAGALIEWYRGYHHQDGWFIVRYVGTSGNPMEQGAGIRVCVGAIELNTGTWSYVDGRDSDRAVWVNGLGRGWSLGFNTSDKAGYPAFQHFEPNIIHHHIFGFHAWSYDESKAPQVSRASLLLIPTWFLAGCAAIAPGVWLAKFRTNVRTRRRLAAGLCSFCGYDLRATPQQCPECGAVPEKAIA